MDDVVAELVVDRPVVVVEVLMLVIEGDDVVPKVDVTTVANVVDVVLEGTKVLELEDVMADDCCTLVDTALDEVEIADEDCDEATTAVAGDAMLDEVDVDEPEIAVLVLLVNADKLADVLDVVVDTVRRVVEAVLVETDGDIDVDDEVDVDSEGKAEDDVVRVLLEAD